MSFPMMDDNDEEQFDEEDLEDIYGLRDGTLFVIDASAPMFKEDPKEGVSYFLQCIRLYQEILRQKLIWNRQDWMGLILFGTNEWDMDPEAKNILTLQKLNPVSKENLIQVMEIDKKKWTYYRDISSSSSYPLHDVLWHAAHLFSSIKLTMPTRRVILFTCQDNPPKIDNNEKHRIREKANSYKNVGIQLYVEGLGENWNHDLFYKDLEILAGQIDSEDYRRIPLKELLLQVKLPSRVMASLPWRLGEDVSLDVSLRNLCVKRQYLKKRPLKRETNEPLMPNSFLVKKKLPEEESEEDDHRSQSPVLETEVKKYREYGKEKIYFTQDEVLNLNSTMEPGIDMICVKPIFYHPLYHQEAPYFVAHGKSYRKDNDLLFAGLLERCESKEQMIICAVTMRKRSAPNLYSMIPSLENGGFYLYKIPFADNVRDLSDRFKQYIYDDKDNKPPTDPEGVAILTKIIKKLRIAYDPELFPNPKLQRQMQTIETLALDLEATEPPPDKTLPMIDIMRERVQALIDKYNEVFKIDEDMEAGPSQKKFKSASGASMDSKLLEPQNICNLIKEKKLVNCTVPQLKEILRNAGLKTTGRKDELMQRIKDKYVT